MKLPPVSIIAAMTVRGGVIGRDGRMPWSLKSDLKRFQKLTTPSAMVMGPKTYKSIGRALPGRLSIVITTARKVEAPPGVEIAHDVSQALHIARRHDYAECFAIGGAAVYMHFMPIAEKLYLTEIDADIEGDTRFPHWDTKQWHRITQNLEWKHHEGDEYPTRFVEYHRLPT